MTEPWPKRKQDSVGRYVRLLRNMETLGGRLFPSGTVMRIHRNYGGLHLEFPIVCSACGTGQVYAVKKVKQKDVELLPTDHVERTFIDDWLPRTKRADVDFMRRHGVRSRAETRDKEKEYRGRYEDAGASGRVVYGVALQVLEWVLGKNTEPAFEQLMRRGNLDR